MAYPTGETGSPKSIMATGRGYTLATTLDTALHEQAGRVCNGSPQSPATGRIRVAESVHSRKLAQSRSDRLTRTPCPGHQRRLRRIWPKQIITARGERAKVGGNRMPDHPDTVSGWPEKTNSRHPGESGRMPGVCFNSGRRAAGRVSRCRAVAGRPRPSPCRSDPPAEGLAPAPALLRPA